VRPAFESTLLTWPLTVCYLSSAAQFLVLYEARWTTPLAQDVDHLRCHSATTLIPSRVIPRPSGLCLIRFNSINLSKTLLSTDPNWPDAIAFKCPRSSSDNPRERLSTRVRVSNSNWAPPNLGGRYYSGRGSGGIYGNVAPVPAFA